MSRSYLDEKKGEGCYMKRERTYGRLVAIEIGGGNEWFREFRRCDRQDLVVGDFGGMSNKWCTWGSDSGI